MIMPMEEKLTDKIYKLLQAYSHVNLTYDKISFYIKNCSTFDEILERLDFLRACITVIENTSADRSIFKRFSFYNVTEQEVTDIMSVLNESEPALRPPSLADSISCEFLYGDVMDASAELSEFEQDAFTCCPARFMYNWVFDSEYYFDDEFSYKRLYTLLLFSRVWKRSIGLSPEASVPILDSVEEELKIFFPCFTTEEFSELRNEAYKQLTSGGMISRGVIQSYHPRYIAGKLQFTDPRKQVVRQGEFERTDFLNYLYGGEQPPASESACKFCNNKNICKEGLLQYNP